MSQPKTFGLFCMNSWFFIFVITKIHIVFIILNIVIIRIIQIRFQQKVVFPDSHRSDLEDSGVTSRRDLHGSQNLGESWKVSGTGSLTESSTQEKDDLNNKCDSANTWPWKKMFSGCFEDKEDKEKYFRSRPGSGRFSNMRFILENPTEVFTRAVTIYERMRQNQRKRCTYHYQIDCYIF